MAIDAVKIPQNIYVEDRIVGPVTLRQIIICLIGMGATYAVWSILKSAGLANIVITAIAWIPTGIAASFAFVKINGISLLRFLLLNIEKSQKPKVRQWQPRVGITINVRTMVPKVHETGHTTSNALKTHNRIEELSAVLDAGPDDVLSPTKEDVEGEDHVVNPVNPSRISADPRTGTSVDGVNATNAPRESTSSPALTMQDVRSV